MLETTGLRHEPKKLLCALIYNACVFTFAELYIHILMPFKCVFFNVHQSRQLESETGTTEEHSLNKEARKWATRVAREHKNIIHYKRVG